jgi:isochorismate hydrolase
MLREMNCRKLVICGLMTHLCCESTARSAFIRGFEVIIPVDGTASYNKRFHLSSLYNLSHGFAVVTSIKELLNRFEE